MTAKVVYLGELRTQAVHIQSGTEIETDAPVDNQGKGARFSPTDLVSAALASCMATIMGIAARTHDIHIEGAVFEVRKVMAAEPRRISEIHVEITLPSTQEYTSRHRAILEHAAETCPVNQSLHPDLVRKVHFHYPG